MPESNRIGNRSGRPCHRKQESASLCYYKNAAYGKCMFKCTKLIFDYGCCKGFGLGSKRVEIYSIALRNSNPNKRISPMLSCRNTRATIGGVSLGTIPEEAGEGAGMVK
jgi:hypothetical protein